MIIFVYRIDAEASILKKKIDDFTKLIVPSDVGNETKTHNAATADIEVSAAIAQGHYIAYVIRLYMFYWILLECHSLDIIMHPSLCVMHCHTT